MRAVDVRTPVASVAPVVAFAIFGYPLTAGLAALFGLPNRPASIAVRGLVLGYSLVLLAWGLRAGRLPEPDRGAAGRWNGEVRSVLLVVLPVFFTLYMGRVLVDAVGYPEMLEPFGWREYLAFGLGSSFVPALAVLVWPIDGRDARLGQWVLAGCVITLLLAGVDVLARGRAVTALSLLAQRAETSTINPITLGEVGTSAVLLSLWRLVRPDRAGSLGLLERGWIGTGLGVGLSAIVLSGSRGPLLALLVGGVLLMPAVLVEWPKRRAWELRLVSLGALAAGYLLVRQGGRLELLRRLLAVVTGSSEPSFDDRVVRWQNAWQTFVAHPWTGAGTTPADYYPHNLMLEALQGSGIVAGLLVGAVYVAGGVRVLSEVRCPDRVHWTTLLWAQFAVHTLFSGAVWDVTAFWVLSAVLASAAGSQRFAATASKRIIPTHDKG